MAAAGGPADRGGAERVAAVRGLGLANSPRASAPIALRHTSALAIRPAGAPMSRAYNFSAGPATLPEAVLAQARDEMLDWRGVGASIVELSHRGPEFIQVAAEAEADLRTLLSVPD